MRSTWSVHHSFTCRERVSLLERVDNSLATILICTHDRTLQGASWVSSAHRSFHLSYFLIRLFFVSTHNQSQVTQLILLRGLCWMLRWRRSQAWTINGSRIHRMDTSMAQFEVKKEKKKEGKKKRKRKSERRSATFLILFRLLSSCSSLTLSFSLPQAPVWNFTSEHRFV